MDRKPWAAQRNLRSFLHSVFSTRTKIYREPQRTLQAQNNFLALRPTCTIPSDIHGFPNIVIRSSNTARALETRSLFPTVGDIWKPASNNRGVRNRTWLWPLTTQLNPQNYRTSHTMIGKWRQKPELCGLRLSPDVLSFRQSLWVYCWFGSTTRAEEVRTVSWIDRYKYCHCETNADTHLLKLLSPKLAISWMPPLELRICCHQN